MIASIDGSALTDVLAKAKEADIKVIAYDRLLMNSEMSIITRLLIILSRCIASSLY